MNSVRFALDERLLRVGEEADSQKRAFEFNSMKRLGDIFISHLEARFKLPAVAKRKICIVYTSGSKVSEKGID